MASLSLALDTLIPVSYRLGLRRHGHHLDIQHVQSSRKVLTISIISQCYKKDDNIIKMPKLIKHSIAKTTNTFIN